MSPRRPSQPAPSLAPFILVGGVGLAVYAGLFGYPPMAAIWASIVISAWLEQPALFTGKKNSYGYATASNETERQAMRRWEMWSDLKFHMLMPNGDWLPSWPVYGSFLASALVAVIALSIPVKTHGSLTVPYGRIIDALAAFIVIAQVSASWRKACGEECPGTRVDTLTTLFSGMSVFPSTVTLLAGGFLGGVVATTAVALARQAHVQIMDSNAVFAAIVVLSCGLFITPSWRKASLAKWRAVEKETQQWEPRWLALKYDPSPRLISRDEVDGVLVLTFNAPPSLGSAEFLGASRKVLPTLDAGTQLAIISVPNEGPLGPMPGTKHPTKFSIVLWSAADLPDMASPDITEELAGLFANCAMSWTLEPLGYAKPVPLSIQRVTAEGEPSVWISRWAWPDGPSLTEIRPLTNDIQAQMHSEVLIDHRADVVYIGALSQHGEVQFIDNEANFDATIANLFVEETWLSVWESVLKSGANPPTIQHATFKALECATTDGVLEIQVQAFTVRVGVDPAEFRGLEPKLATALESSAFVSIIGWPGPGDRPGDRHPQAFAVCWSSAPLPNVEEIAPSPGAKFALAGLINASFDAVKLPRPEVASVAPLTSAESLTHIWQLFIRLYGGITASDVRNKAERLRQTLGAAWLRIADDEDGCVMYVGADPESVELADPANVTEVVARLDWSQAWQSSGVVGANGELPDLLSVGSMPKNNAVSIYTFAIPAGVDKGRIRGSLSSLRASTNNEYLEVRDVDGVASQIRVLASRVNPLPKFAAFDFGVVDRCRGTIPFATGIDGEPVVFDPVSAPHALLAGTTGSGKAQPLDAIVPVPISLRYPLGVATIGQLTVGDSVFAHDGTTTRILSFSAIQDEQVYLVRFDDGQTVRCSGEHLWVVNRRGHSGAVMCTKDLVNSPYRWWVDIPQPIFGQKMADAIPSYELGATLAKLEIAESVGASIPYALASRGTTNYRRRLLQEWAGHSPTLTRAGSAYTASCLTEEAAGVIAQLIRSLGVKVSIDGARLRFWPGSNLLGLSTSKRDTKRLDRAKHNAKLNIVTVYPTPSTVPMRCLVVDHPQHQYLTDGFIPTHNSVMARAFLYGAAINGNDIYIVDPVKGGADFHFVQPFAKAIATDVIDAAALMAAVRKEVDRRKQVNLTYHVASGDDLPEVIRYPRITLLIDEFTSLVGKEPVGEKTDDPVAAMERERVIMENTARSMIGSLAGRIAREARSSRVTLLLGTQKLAHATLDTIPGGNDLKTNLARSLLGKATSGERMSALRAPDAAPVVEGEIPQGRGIWEPLTSSGVIVQCWFAPQETMSKELNARRAPLATHELLDLGPFRSPDYERIYGGGSDTEDVIDLGEVVFELDEVSSAGPLPVDTDLLDTEWSRDDDWDFTETPLGTSNAKESEQKDPFSWDIFRPASTNDDW